MIVSSVGPTSARRRVLAGLATLVVAGGLLTTLGDAAPAGAEPGDVVVAENFDSGTLPAGWRAIDGEWKVVDGRLVGTSTSGNRKITFGRHLEHFRFSATVRFEKVNEATRWTALGLDVPASGATPWWIATMRSGSAASNGLEFAQLTPAGSWNVTNTTAAPYAAGTGRDVKVSIEVHGNQARWFFDGRQLMRTSSLQRSADGGQALVVNGATVSFDDVTVTELAPNGLLRPEGAPLTVIAHRGASAAAPENTLAAQEVARRAGSDWIENDVQPSRDGVPFVLHDGTVDRTTDGTGAIRNLTSAQLKALDAGSWFAPHFTGARLPTLAEQLADLRSRGGNLLLEIKGAHSRDEVARIVEVIRAERMTTRVFVQSFDVESLRHTRALAPELPLGLLRSTLDADPVALSKELGLAAYNPSDGALTTRPSVVADLHAAGVAVMVWTVDSATAWQRLEGYGVDGVITNRPAELAGWNAAQLQGGVGRPTVAVASPADGARLDRAQRPTLGVVTGNANTVTVTLDGEPATPGQVLDASRLAAGEHTIRVEANGPGGRTTVTTTFTVVADPTGLAHLVLTAQVEAGARHAMLNLLADGRYAQLASYAEQHAGRQVPQDAATIIAADARALLAAG